MAPLRVSLGVISFGVSLTDTFFTKPHASRGFRREGRKEEETPRRAFQTCAQLCVRDHGRGGCSRSTRPARHLLAPPHHPFRTQPRRPRSPMLEIFQQAVLLAQPRMPGARLRAATLLQRGKDVDRIHYRFTHRRTYSHPECQVRQLCSESRLHTSHTCSPALSVS